MQPPAPPPTPPPTSPGVSATTYTVQKGDSLSGIAKKFGVTVSAVAAANNITNIALIRVGQILMIPTSSAGPAQPQSPPTPQPPSQPQPPSPPPPVDSGWCPFAIRRPITFDNYDLGRSGHQVIAVVLHIAAGPLRAVFPTFNNPDGNASAHFCVGKDGTIEQYLSIDDTAYAVGMRYSNGQWFNPRGLPANPTWQDILPPYNPNMYTISIEHEGQPEDQWTAQMYDANNRLLQWIASAVGQSLESGAPLEYVPHRTLIGHYEIDPVDRPHCPGPNVDYERIAADANAASVSPEELAAIQAAAREREWLPINDESALFRFAQAHNLGCPQTDEFQFAVGADLYLGQVFNLGIDFVKQGDWDNIQAVNKPDGSTPATDAAAVAAIAAAQQETWLPINTGSAFYKFAQAQGLGCPQTDEFDFAVEEDYVGQVYSQALVFARKRDLSALRFAKKPDL